MDARAHLRISGRVQGVFFRQSAKEEADRRGLRGWVRNLPGGEVEAIGEGPREALDAWIAWCRKGPPAATVAEVEVTWEAPTGELGAFEVRR